MIRTRLIIRHRGGCVAVREVREGRWGNPWSDTSESVYRARDGTDRGSSHRFRVYRCNDPDCPAKLFVSDNDMLDAIVKQDGTEHHCQ